MEHISNFETFNESKESTKKPKSVYFTKRVPITKLDLEHICKNLNLPFEKLKFLSAGSFGNAYKVGDRVLKISTDKSEAKSVYDLLKRKKKQNESVIKYYDILRYRMNKSYVYVIVMDYATPLVSYIKRVKDTDLEDFLEFCSDIFFDKWDELESEEQFIEMIQKEYDFDSLPKLGVHLVYKFWTLYTNLTHEFDSCPDIHIHNLGLKEDGEIVMFDYSSLESVRKFDQPRIIPYSKLESIKH